MFIYFCVVLFVDQFFKKRGAGRDCCSTLKTSCHEKSQMRFYGTLFCSYYGNSNMFAGANNALPLQNGQLLED